LVKPDSLAYNERGVIGLERRRYPMHKKETVVLLHGLRRTGRSMKKTAQALGEKGYVPVIVDYHSRRHAIEYLADEVLHEVLESLPRGTSSRVHFVTHSMGGIIVRYYLKHHPMEELGRVVMLSPPNQGSELVDLLKDSPVFKILHGPAGQQLGTADRFLKSLGPVHFELGVIAGLKTGDPVSGRIIPGPNDGKVGVERTKVPGMRDFLVVPYSHTFIMRPQAVIDQVAYFLRHGLFLREPQ
jgi:pimeloyl-ACP methyl ester carboxylesterase